MARPVTMQRVVADARPESRGLPYSLSSSFTSSHQPSYSGATRQLTSLQSTAGFSLDILPQPPDQKYLCSICRLILRNPIQSFCGHRFCRSCFEEYVRSSKKSICEPCKEENGEGEYCLLQIDKTFPDNAIKREFNSMTVNCPNPNCSWTGLFKFYEDHERSCPYKVIEAKPAAVSVDTSFIQTLVTDATLPLQVKLLDMETSSSGWQAEQQEVNRQLHELLQRIQYIEQLFQQTMASAQTRVTDDYVPSRTLDEIYTLKDKVTSHHEITGIVNFQMAKCQKAMDVMKLQASQEERIISEHKELVKILDGKLRAVEKTLLVKDAALADMNMRLQFLELTSHDGTLLWRITDFKKRHQDAVAGKVTSFYSPCFYTNRQGYKMCARAYLNGDGMGKGTHISLFFVIMRGTYDALLPWPFRQKVTFMLLDQTRKEHIIDAFRPDPASTSFKRPTSEMNIASGCPLFMAISQLEADGHAYVKDDTMFVKIIVDTQDLT